MQIPKNGFPSHMCSLIPTECELMKLSKILIRNDWQAVLYELGLHTANIDQCKHSHSLESMQCMSGLILWLRKNGKAATFKSLYIACENSDVDIEFLSNIIKLAEMHLNNESKNV